MLVPEVVWANSASIRVVGGCMLFVFMPFISMGIFIGAAWFSCGVFFGAGMFMPGISGIGDGFVCAWMAGAAKRPNESRANVSFGSMRFLFLHCMAGRQRGDAARRVGAGEESDSKRDAGRGLGRLYLRNYRCATERGDFVAKEEGCGGDRWNRPLDFCGNDGWGFLLRATADRQLMTLRRVLRAVVA